MILTICDLVMAYLCGRAAIDTDFSTRTRVIAGACCVGAILALHFIR